MKVIAIVQARMGSTRLPNKVMLPVGNDIPIIEALITRLKQSALIDQIIIAMPTNDANKPLAAHVKTLGTDIFEGDEDNVLGRYYHAAVLENPDIVVRITGDCPLVDPKIVDDVISHHLKSQCDVTSNIQPPTYPDGLDVEVFSFKTLQKTFELASKKREREHVTPFMYESGLFTVAAINHDHDLSSERWTIDETDDYIVINNIFSHFAPDLHFTWTDILTLKKQQPDLFKANRHIARNEGSVIGTGQKLWKRAKKVIPGGSMLLSKRPEMFLPDHWPAYFSKSKGCHVWDMDDNKFIDTSIMGIGTNILGYGHPEIDKAVLQTVKSGNMSTFNCPEEVYLAEKLIELHPWADMVRLARAGGEANAIAIRIARAASGKDKVAICGYHGWHDWYLSANLADEQSLDGHLLPGLDPKGVPRNLKNSVLPFNYNNIAELENLIKVHDIGVIKMEVQRSEAPKDNFLHQVRKLATEHNIVLVFDECTSGFRETLGGLHLKYGVEPDIAVYGKALGNGYAISAIIGRREVMEAAQSTFISSTFWTERIGPTAALKTLEVMQREESWLQITQTGLNIKQQWQQLADEHGLSIEQWGIPALAGFTIKSQHALAYKTLITQEMLKQGYLADNRIYVCTEHSESILDSYFERLGAIFALIKQCEDGKDPQTLLDGPICHSAFKRLN